MEGKAEFTSTAITVYGASDIPDGYPVAAHTAAPVNPATNVEGPSMEAFPPVNVPPSCLTSTGNLKRKRGRPRKYGPDCSSGPVFSPVPISAIPLPPEFPDMKRASKSESQTPDDLSPFQRGRDFTLHIITVNAGEDVAMKIEKAFSKSRAITVISASGCISLVTIRRPDAAGGRVIYEGHFEVVSLNGSFVPMKKESLASKCGGMSVSLVDGEGKTIAGELAGMFIAESNVTVTMASFLPCRSNQRKRKRAGTEPSSAPSPTMGPGSTSGPGPTMDPPCDKEPMNPNGNFSLGSSSQASPSAQHEPSQDNRDLGTGDNPSAMMLLDELNGNGESRFMTSG